MDGIPLAIEFAAAREPVAEHNEASRAAESHHRALTGAREAQAAMRSSREAGLKVMHTLTQNYATLVSGVLIGLSEALEHGKPKTKH